MARDPLEGKTLATILGELVQHYGWPYLGTEIAINCFRYDPSLKSSLIFLRRTPWARAKVETLYRQHLASQPVGEPSTDWLPVPPGHGASPADGATLAASSVTAPA